jgi:hypothetical protein
MKKLFFLLALLPLFAIGQNNIGVYPDYFEKVRDVSNAIKIDGKLSVLQVNTDNENYDVVAINDKMQVVWRTPMVGYAMAVAKFKGKIIAIAATDHSSMLGKNNTYKAVIIDPANGKAIVTKTIYEGEPEYMDFPEILINQDNFWGIGVRQSTFKRKMHVAAPGIFALFSISKFDKQYHDTNDLNVFQYDENLNVINTFKPEVLPTATYAGMQVNDFGDVFVTWFSDGKNKGNDGGVDIHRYEYGKKQQAGKIKADIGLRSDFLSAVDAIQFATSLTSRSKIYLGLFYTNTSKDLELGLGTFDLASGQKKFITEVFDKAHVKAVEKEYVEVNNKLHGLSLSRSLQVRHFEEVDGALVMAATTQGTQSSSINRSGTWMLEWGMLIQVYEPALTLKYRQFVPFENSYPNRRMPIAYNFTGTGKLRILATDKTGATTMNALYAVLDLKNGKWDRMERLSKKKIDNSSYADGSAALWFDNFFYVPYLEPKGFTGNKFNVTYQQNSY